MPQDPFLVPSRLVELSREFGQARWTILGEGNTSGRIDEKVFAVKSSGSSLGTLTEIELTHCYFDALLPVLQTYLGHSSIGDTAYYLHLTAESYPDITARVNQTLGDVVPPLTAGPNHGD